MKTAKAMTKGQLADQLATKSELKKKEVLSVLQNLSEIGASEVTTTGKFVLPGLCMIKTRARAVQPHVDCWRAYGGMGAEMSRKV
ncbi:unnamed protein product [Symbiodinium microadriaticum]|nr:unnamed protein product [Symbiodinium microadriaticum]